MSGSLLPNITYAAINSPLYASASGGGGGGSYPSVATFSTINVSSICKSRTFLTSTIVLPPITANASTAVFAFPNNETFGGLWSVAALVADAQPGAVAGAQFAVNCVNSGVGTDNYWSAVPVASGASAGYSLSIYTAGTANAPPTVYIDNATATSAGVVATTHQIG